MVFEHRIYENGKVSSHVVRSFVGEDQRAIAYYLCPRECVVYERKVN